MTPIASLALAASFFFPDVLLPGQASVTHELVLSPSAALEGHVLIASPSAGFGGVHIVAPGEPFRFSGKYGTKLYAVPESEDLAPIRAPDLQQILDYPRSTPPVFETSSVSTSNPLRRILTTFEVTEIEGESLQVRVLMSEEFGGDGKPLVVQRRAALPWFALAGIGLALGVAVFAVSRSRGAQETA